jgi:hypothetical protein
VEDSARSKASGLGEREEVQGKGKKWRHRLRSAPSRGKVLSDADGAWLFLRGEEWDGAHSLRCGGGEEEEES